MSVVKSDDDDGGGDDDDGDVDYVIIWFSNSQCPYIDRFFTCYCLYNYVETRCCCSSVYSNRIQVDETIFWPVDVLMVFAID
jgi:hypothetical protein